MNAANQTTRLGQLRQERKNANRALAQYDLEVERTVLISTDTNLIYKVRTTDGQRYVLRLANPGWRTRANAESEVMWLDALARDTDIPVPRILRSKNQEAVVGATENQHALLMTWLPGMLLGKRLTEANLFKMGELFGKLHLHADTWKAPEGFAPHRFDGFMSRGERDTLATEVCLAQFPTQQRESITRMRTLVETAYAAQSPKDLCVIHCDLWHDNIKVFKGELAPFDFEDTIWGYRLHDLAMALLDLIEDAGVERYRALLPVFRQGYEQHLPWPDGNLGLFQMGRVLWRLNWVASNHPEALVQEAASCARLFEDFESGTWLTKGSG